MGFIFLKKGKKGDNWPTSLPLYLILACNGTAHSFSFLFIFFPLLVDTGCNCNPPSRTCIVAMQLIGGFMISYEPK